MSHGREWTKDNYGGKCELKMNREHERSVMFLKGETPECAK